jgi:hypothetical protein
VPVETIYHPTERVDIKWSPDHFFSNTERKIIQIGYWLRNLHAIYMLPKSTYRKVFLIPRMEPWFKTLFEKESEYFRKIGLYHQSMDEDVIRMSFVPNREYDALLSENIVFLHLYDASATNTVLECIARATPLLVNPLPSITEYLGKEYPLYYNTYEEAIQKAMDIQLILATHDYLTKFQGKEKLTPQFFFESIINSNIYKQLQS